MDIRAATANYEAWLGKGITLIDTDLAHKHAAMSEAAFPFLRATFYRWAQLWPQVCPDCVKAPEVLGVGDLHVENFGTWRDVEGRLTWGINDFDEAYPMPYTVDLVRLAASAHLAIAMSHLRIEKKDACAAILAGYTEGLASGGQTFVLAEHHSWLRALVAGILRDPVPFWSKFDELPTLTRELPPSALRALRRMLPDKKLECRFVHRTAGLGSLGRQRFVAVADFRGGKIAREAKALAPSACIWAENRKSARTDGKLRYQQIIDQAVRAVDPFVRLKGRWIVRRLAPDCSRVELASMPKLRDEARLLHAMGFETANIHLGTKEAVKTIGNDLKKRPHGWLHHAAERMVKATIHDWKEWQAKAETPAEKPVAV
ncbi:MAG: DUF2252 domain-containing protein [Acidobacteriota bacterium]|nr:DUF2252 domain-containing protein [Acidobacteriota bacterium]